MIVFTCSILKNSSSSTSVRPAPSFFQTSRAFTIFIIEIVVFQYVIFEKTGLQAIVYSTHCTAIKGINMLKVNHASRSFVIAHQVVKVFLITINLISGVGG